MRAALTGWVTVNSLRNQTAWFLPALSAQIHCGAAEPEPLPFCPSASGERRETPTVASSSAAADLRRRDFVTGKLRGQGTAEGRAGCGGRVVPARGRGITSWYIGGG